MLWTISASLGYPALATLVFGESAGIPVPGETALITAGGLAASGSLALWAVVAIAAAAAIAGDTLGYWLGRSRGRAFLERGGFLAAHRRRALSLADRFFARHGALTVFAGRFVPGVRVVAAVLAGATQLSWRRFAVPNALGAVTWATVVGGSSYLLGSAGAAALALTGLACAALATAASHIRPWFSRAAAGAGA